MYNSSIYKEKELLLKIAEGDEQAFRLLVKAYHNRTATYLLQLTGSRPLTEELLQDVFMKVWTSRAQLAELENFDAWLFILARNHAFNSLSRIAREKKRQQQWEREVMQGMESVNDASVAEKQLQLLEEAIQQLPPQQRKIYLLSRREGLSSLAIQQQLGLSIDTIKKHRSLAVKNIKSYLQKYLSIFL